MRAATDNRAALGHTPYQQSFIQCSAFPDKDGRAGR
jgi:hypothetical protein